MNQNLHGTIYFRFSGEAFAPNVMIASAAAVNPFLARIHSHHSPALVRRWDRRLLRLAFGLVESKAAMTSFVVAAGAVAGGGY